MSIFSSLKKKATEAVKPIVTPLRPFPFTVEGANLRYAYDMDLTPTSHGSIEAALGDAEKVVSVLSKDGAIVLSYNGIAFATVADPPKAKMVEDYLRRGDPVNAVLRANKKASVRFYRDMRKGAENNRQTVVTLSDCKSKSRQEVLYGMSVGQELGCFGNDQIYVCDYFGQGSAVIGKLPAKATKMAEESQIRAIYLEALDEDGDKYIPSVRIYWSDKE